MYLERIVADASQFNTNPAARPNVGRLEIRRRLLLDQRRLKTLGHGQPHGEVAILVMVVGKHREQTFIFLDEERRRAVRELFRDVWQRGAESSDALQLSVAAGLAGTLAFVTLCELFGAEPGDALDQPNRNRLGQREPESASGALILCKLVSERRDERIARGIQRIMMLPAGEIEHGNAVERIYGHPIRDRSEERRVGNECRSGWAR